MKISTVVSKKHEVLTQNKQSNLLRKRTNKRTGKGRMFKDFSEGLLFVFLLPYVATCFWGHSGYVKSSEGMVKETESKEICLQTKAGTIMISEKEYLAYQLSKVMSADYETEAMKAQAILLRTALVQEDVFVRKVEELPVIGSLPQCCYEAVQSTEGMYLCYRGAPIEVCYFPISNGKTRALEEHPYAKDEAIFCEEKNGYSYAGNAECEQTNPASYLVSVETLSDRSAEQYEQTIIIDREVYDEKMMTLFREAYTTERNDGKKNDDRVDDEKESKDKADDDTQVSAKTEEEPNENKQKISFLYDSSGYVTEVSCGTAKCNGEIFREKMGLPSASFTMEETEKRIFFHTKGVGHGYGMSRYGANVMAVNGANYREILSYFFPGTELVKENN